MRKRDLCILGFLDPITGLPSQAPVLVPGSAANSSVVSRVASPAPQLWPKSAEAESADARRSPDRWPGNGTGEFSWQLSASR